MLSLEDSLARGQALSNFLTPYGGWWPGVRAPGRRGPASLGILPIFSIIFSIRVDPGSTLMTGSPGASTKTPPSFPKRKQKD